jgi:CRP/FNR family cyclic AMP-dependent transcriptional regulator
MAKPIASASPFELLRRVPLFADIPVEDLQLVARKSQAFWKPAGARIFEEGSPADCCLVLTFGSAKAVISSSQSPDVILGMLEPYALIGEIALLDNSTRSASLETLTRSHFIKIPGSTFLELRNNRAFEDRLVAHVTATLRRATEQLRAFYTYNSLERVAWCLARLAHQEGEPSGSEISISPKPTHQTLADMTGYSRETVSRVLLRLRRMKWATWDKESLRLQPAAIRRYAADQPMAL